MRCPIQTAETAELLLAYSARKLDAESTQALEKHMEICPECRQFAAQQQAVWKALDGWEAAPVSRDFDRRLYQRIEREVSWFDLLMRPFRPLLVRQGLPIAAAAGIVMMAGFMLERPTALPPAPPVAQVESLQPEQVEHALADMEMLSDLTSQSRNE